jgi:hypothetical protein
MPKYKDDVRLVKKLLPIDHPCYEESKRLADMPSCFEPDESKSFIENLKSKFVFDLRRQTIQEIRNLKARFYRETGENL